MLQKLILSNSNMENAITNANFQKVAAPISKGSKKSGHPFTNVNFINAASSILKGSQKSGHTYIN